VLLLAIFGGIGGYLYNKFATLAATDFSPPPITIAAAVAKNAQWESRLEAIGTIKAVRGVHLSTEESGEITAINVASGSEVKAGDLLLVQNDKLEVASRKRQIANLDLAKLLFERDSKLIKQKSIPQTQYDRSKADLESAIAQLAETEARLANKRLIAPFDGTVGIVQVRVGDYVVPGTTITTLQDLSELEVDFTVPARHFPQLRQGLEIEVQVAAFPEKTFSATLQAADSEVDPGTRSLLLRASLDNSAGLLPGMFAQLDINLNRPVSVITVPETAISYSLHGNTVYVIEETDGEFTVEPILVETGQSAGGLIAVTRGLSGGERVVSVGQNKLYRGARVIIDESVNF
jgi:membrane fusion protein (multidrug efflux system)